jgi:sulfur relay (sulfurtransferase) complex TusBCD TusD component (DsrE family)
MMTDANQLVNVLLESVRVCAACQKERGIAGQPGESHGLCRRHFMAEYAYMFTPEEIASWPDEKFSPEMFDDQNLP